MRKRNVKKRKSNHECLKKCKNENRKTEKQKRTKEKKNK